MQTNKGKANRAVWLIVGLAVLIVIIWVIYFSLTDGDEDTIKVGGMFALTGNRASIGTTESNFLRLAIEDINSNGGVNGKNLTIILEDDACDAKTSATAANKLVYQDGVKVIFGPGCANAASGATPVTEKENVIIFAATTTVSNIFDNYTYAFRVSPPADDAANLMAQYAYQQKGYKNVGIITEQNIFAMSWTNAFVKRFKELGGNIDTIEEYMSGNNDFRESLSEINAKNVDAVYISGQNLQEMGLILRQMSELGMLNKVKVFGNLGLIDPEVDKISGKALPEDAFTVVAYSENTYLHDKYVITYGDTPKFQFFYTAAVYDSAYIIKEALESCDEDTTCIREYLLNHTFKGTAVSEWKFNSMKDPEIPIESYRILRLVDGKQVFEEINN